MSQIEKEEELNGRGVTQEERKEIREKENKDEKKRRKRILLLLLLLLLLLFIFGLTAKYGSNIIENIQNLLGNKVPSAPEIDGGSEEWARERLIKVVKDSESEEGLAYYEYCMSSSKSTDKCVWKRTDTKNMKAIDTGIYYITFRGIDNVGKKSKNSNQEVVYIDNVNPMIEDIKVLEKTTTSIKIIVDAKDAHSGVAKYEYSLDGENYTSGSNIFTYSGLEKDTEYKLYVRVTDKVGNSVVVSVTFTTVLADDSCELNCDTDDDGKCDYNCDTDGDGECDLNCDNDNDGECDRNCDDDGDGECDTNCEEEPTKPEKPGEDDEEDECKVNCDDDGDGECDRNCDEEPEEEWDIPIIHLNGVPSSFPQGSKYELPTYVSFGNDTGTYSCTIKNTEYKDTSTLSVGKHVIMCTATSSHGISTSIAKEVEVTLSEDKDGEIIDGWIIITLYYPPNSTNWMWRVGKEGEIREGYESGWQPYTGPILVRLSDVDDVYISYELNGEIYVEAPAGRVAVDIRPDQYEVVKGETTRVVIYYQEGVKTKEYKIGTGEWQEYTGPFEVGPNTLIEARGTKEEDVYDSAGNYAYTAKIKGTDSVFIREYASNSGGSSSSGSTGGGNTGGAGSSGGSGGTGSGSSGSEGNTGGSGSSGENEDSNSGNEGNTGGSGSSGSGSEGNTGGSGSTGGSGNSGSGSEGNEGGSGSTGGSGSGNTGGNDNEGESGGSGDSGDNEDNDSDDDNVTKPEVPSTYLKGPIITGNPENELTEKVEISITTEEEAYKIYVKIGNGKYQEYTEPFLVTENILIEAYYIRKSDGQISVESYYYVDNIKPKNLPYVKIDTNPSDYLSEEVEEVIVTITGEDYDTLEYSLNGVIYQKYIEPLTITESSTIYAKGTNKNGETIVSKVITTVVAPTVKEELDVSIYFNPEEENITEVVNKVKVEISYDARATERYYKIGYDGEWLTYTGEFEVNENTTIYAYCTSENGEGSTSRSISYLTNGISDPIININPTNAASYVRVEIEYDKNASIKKYKIGNGEYKDYTGAFYIDENTTIYAYNEDVLGHHGESSREITNIVVGPSYTILDLGQYFLIRLNYPDESSHREYKWTVDGTWRKYDPKGILLVKEEFKDEIDASDGIKINYEGQDLIFTDHYYYVDVPWSEISEHLFMRWDMVPPNEPKIIINPTEYTKEVTAIINYSADVTEKYYKLTYPNGEETDWLEYTGPLTITENNVVVHAKGINSQEVSSNIVSKKITNIDKEPPIINQVEIIGSGSSYIKLSVNANDAQSGILYYSYSIDGKEFTKSSSSSHIFTKLKENVKYTIYIKVEDNLENMTEVYEIEATTKEIGEITFEVSPASGWAVTKDVMINYPVDEYSDYIYQYSLDLGETWLEYDGKLTITENETTIIARVIDGVNIKESSTLTITQIDPTVPTISLDGVPSEFEKGESYDLPTSYTDGPSGSTIKCTINDASTVTYTTTADIPGGGNNTITCIITTGAGVSRSVSKDVRIFVGGSGILYEAVQEQAILDNIASEFVISETGIDFSQISSDTNGKGVYTIANTVNNEYPIHYYRGDVKNNHVIFAGFCWDIVRTTDTGGVKLLYDGKPTSDGACTNSYDNSLQGTQLFSSANVKIEYNGSYVKSRSVDDWYSGYLINYTDYIEDTVWCNDLELTEVNRIRYYGAYYRMISDKEPSLDCSQLEDRFTVNGSKGNGLLTYPVGLITIDEAAYAGGVYGTSNSSYYLNIGMEYWTMSPNHIGYPYTYAYVFTVRSNGGIGGAMVGTYVGVRPAISLKSGIKYSEGDGTESNPYIILED